MKKYALIKGIFYYFVLLAILGTFIGCCELGFTCIRVCIIGNPPLKDAEIHIDGKLVGSLVDDYYCTDFKRKKRYEIRVLQKGYKPLTTFFQSKPDDRDARGFVVKLEPLDSVGQTETLPSDTAAK